MTEGVVIPDDISELLADNNYCHAVCNHCWPIEEYAGSEEPVQGLCGKIVVNDAGPDAERCRTCLALFGQPCKVCGR